MFSMSYSDAAESGRLLCLLFLRLGKVSACAVAASLLYSLNSRSKTGPESHVYHFSGTYSRNKVEMPDWEAWTMVNHFPVVSSVRADVESH